HRLTYYAVYVVVFFFCHSRLHCDLHSFPTRRSSDLATLAGHDDVAAVHLFAGADDAVLHLGATALDTDTLFARAGDVALKGYRRSEEHTSELQSRGHLVCRLLLEKKKKRREVSLILT